MFFVGRPGIKPRESSAAVPCASLWEARAGRGTQGRTGGQLPGQAAAPAVTQTHVADSNSEIGKAPNPRISSRRTRHRHQPGLKLRAAELCLDGQHVVSLGASVPRFCRRDSGVLPQPPLGGSHNRWYSRPVTFPKHQKSCLLAKGWPLALPGSGSDPAAHSLPLWFRGADSVSQQWVGCSLSPPPPGPGWGSEHPVARSLSSLKGRAGLPFLILYGMCQLFGGRAEPFRSLDSHGQGPGEHPAPACLPLGRPEPPRQRDRGRRRCVCHSHHGVGRFPRGLWGFIMGSSALFLLGEERKRP